MGLNWTTSSPAVDPGKPFSRVPRPQQAKAALVASPERFEQLLQRVRAEYLEMPGLNLTQGQARCLWALDEALCESLLAHLVAAGFLQRTAHGTFVRVS